MESQILNTLAGSAIDNSASWAAQHKLDHNEVVGCIKSLMCDGYVTLTMHEVLGWAATEEGVQYAATGSPEAQVFNAVPPSGGILLEDLNSLLPCAKVGVAQAMQRKWISVDKSSGAARVIRSVASVEDVVQGALQALSVASAAAPELQVLDGLKKRKLVAQTKLVYYGVTKGPSFALQRRKKATDLTTDMLAKGTWQNETFKAYNFDALGTPVAAGHLHPLLKVRAAYRQIFLEMGFNEMPTNRWVESSFWNFDALFQPQAHPARDLHDTFFLKTPASCASLPSDYVARVKQMHECGGDGSHGYNYDWLLLEAEKNVLRTHTTAVSSRVLRALSLRGFTPGKYFSIDRVFRNESIDKTHLAEFHQIEGIIIDRNIGLGDLIGVLQQFFERLGVSPIRFKPAYNPYTEPSMEIFTYIEGLDKWVEIGNSGIFRPEMLGPMGLSSDVTAIAWGLSLERPTMKLYGINNIRFEISVLRFFAFTLIDAETCLDLAAAWA
jgi:phenylalanyl-tRNA synthetase alpha chain